MDYNEILARWLEGRTTIDEERQLREWREAPGWARAAFGALERGAVSVPSRRRLWSVPTAAAVLLGALFVWQTINSPTIYGYIDGRPITDFDVAYTHTRSALGILQNNMQTPEKVIDFLN